MTDNNLDQELGASSVSPYVSKRPLAGRVVCVLDVRSEHQSMQLEAHRSRAVKAGEIHELAFTDHPDASPGEKVDRVAFAAFIEFEQGGVILVGDKVTLANRELGRVAGFNEKHFPNHMNILVRGSEWQTGRGLGLVLEDRMVFARDQ